jgi:VanZ family protein
MYSMLLVATPFLLLQRFLQDAIGIISSSTLPVAGIKEPIVPSIAVLLLLVLIILFHSRLTRRRILAGVAALLMIAVAQQITDYYFGHKFYDLQQNWHYLAYMIFAFMVYRDLAPRGFPLYEILLITYFGTLLLSTFDETFQRHMSARIFDISDIAKDVWGSLVGIVLICLGGKKAEALLARGKPFRHPRVEDYVKSPKSLLVLLFVLGFLLLAISSLLSDAVYWGSILLLTVSASVLFFVLFHISQYKWGKYGLVSILVVALCVQSYFFVRYREDNIVSNSYGVTVYKGIPIFFFDVMIFPDGMFRLVDKKHDFNYRDRRFLMQQKADIVLIGSGANGLGGNGFPTKAPSQFFYNHFTKRATQIIILKTPQACQVFNRLKREHKNVLFVLHNTC